jgi:hypothetical protein
VCESRNQCYIDELGSKQNIKSTYHSRQIARRFFLRVRERLLQAFAGCGGRRRVRYSTLSEQQQTGEERC